MAFTGLESAGTGTVNLKVVPNECYLGRQVTMDQLICASLSHTPTIGMKWLSGIESKITSERTALYNESFVSSGRGPPSPPRPYLV